MKVLYLCHGMYGCETGCCGYRLCSDDEGDYEVGAFVFAHPPRDQPQDSASFVRKHWPELVDENTEIRWGKWKECNFDGDDVSGKVQI